MQVLPDRMHHHTRQSHCPLSTNSLHYVDHGEHCKYAGIPTLTPLSVGVLPLLPTLEDNNALPHLQTNNTFITSHLTMQVLLGIIHPHTPQPHCPCSTVAVTFFSLHIKQQQLLHISTNIVTTTTHKCMPTLPTPLPSPYQLFTPCRPW